MKILLTTHLLFILFVTLITPVHASVTMQATISQDIHVVFDFKNINSTIYNEIEQQGSFNISTIPKTIEKNLEDQNLKNVRLIYDPFQDVFDDSTSSIHVEFYLGGSDIINFTFNKTTMARIYNVTTGWRKFHVNLTESYSLDFAEYFGAPVADWDFENETTPAYYYHNYTSLSDFDPICYFTLPLGAINVHVAEDGDTIIFEAPPLLGDVLLNSPFLILGALIIVITAAFLYRRIRK